MRRLWILVAGVVAILVALLATSGTGRPGSPAASAGATTAQPSATAGSGQPEAVDLVALRKAAGIADCPSSSDAAAVPGGLPELTLECLGGDSSVRLAGLRGPLLVNLWAQWCEPCRAEGADLAAFASGQEKVAVLGINYSDPQPQLAIEFAQLMGQHYPQLVDEEATVRGPLGVVGIPHTLLLDSDGVVVAQHPGRFSSLADLKAWVDAGLAR